MFNYDNRYSLQANFRADAFDSSKLPKESRWGYFPSVSAGWTISNESFFKENIDRNVVSFLKLRGSYGVNGNINVLRDYPYSTSINYNSLWYQYTVGDPTLTYGSIPAGLANPDLKWETSTQLDLGLDARFLDNRLSLGVDFYNKITDDLLIQVSPVMEVGSTANQTINAGSIMNRGLEIELGWRDQIGDFGYSVSGNMGFLKNEVTYLDQAVDRVPGRITQGTKMSTICEQGYPLWYILGYKTDGFKSDGSIKYVDANGDGGFDDNDRVCLGSAIPSFTYGFTINMNWKNFDFTVFGTGVSGNKISQQSFRSDRPFCNTYSYYWENSWKEGNEANAKFPAAKFWTQEAFSSDLNVFSGAYFKIKQIQLGYTVPKKYTAKAQMSQVRLFASLENYFTFTNYFGLDPETATTGGNAAAFDMGTYPTSKQFIMGINVSF
jgi:TonB-linked SusC/RagA family outer membrane protein